MATYALPQSHKEVRIQSSPATFSLSLTHRSQMLEKSLLDSDPEVADIMVSMPFSRPARAWLAR
jgi:hypothetical protein